jgi:hypothetical protein
MYNERNHTFVASNNKSPRPGKCMEILRLAVILWLFLPLFILTINRFWHAYRLSHYPVIYTARVVDVSAQKGLPDGYSKQFTYAYRVMGIDYTAQVFQSNKARKAGEEIPIRYNPSQPAQSIAWEPMPRSDWIFLALMWLSVSLGYAIFSIFISLYLLVLFITHRRALKRSQTNQAGLTTSMIFILVFAIILLLVVGVSTLLKDGFWGQNWLLRLWNLAFGINWNTLVGIIEWVVFFLVAAAIGGIFSILRKKMNPWLAFIIIVVIFLAIIFGYVFLKIEYIEPLLTPQARAPLRPCSYSPTRRRLL